MSQWFSKWIGGICILLILPLSVLADGTPTDAEIKAILQERIDMAKKGVGIVVGIVDEHGTRVISYGRLDAGKGEVDGDTLFEIGSVTKVFTTLLLQDMIERGEMRLGDPVAKFLPSSVKVPSRGGREITLFDLATHTSALPRLPDNLAPRDDANPYADYSDQQLYAFLTDYTLTGDIGAKYEYSNLGMGLLGHAIALKAGTNYEALVRERICRPLKMDSTVITLTPELNARLATGHNTTGQPVENWDFDAMAGAGALRSTVNDLLKFVSANLGLTPSSLTPLMAKTHEVRRPAVEPGHDMALGWHTLHKHVADLIWHNGGTGGYHAFVGFDKQAHRGVVVLANSENAIDDLGFHLLETQYPLTKFEPAQEHKQVTVDSKIYDDYVGQYQLGPSAKFTVRRDGEHLTAQLTGQAAYEVFPESETNFFYTVVDAQLTFVRDGQGKVIKLILHQNGIDQEADKTSDAPPPERAVLKLDHKIYDAYVGRYEIASDTAFTITRDGDRLLAQLTGQPVFEIFPESETNFFYKVVDAQITFVKDDKGEVSQLVLHQNGMNLEAKKVK